ncbi:hypothetical protein F4780DRAFT_772391 [Xylariomycetidae sp. FL0641]|nr:hypothetical protein F4780DRAFT_772391 [Xylariomycetidae sp. FL0641]
MLTHVLALAATASAHGFIADPPMRTAGDATAAACGAGVAAEITRDKTSHVEGLPELAAQAGSGYQGAGECNLWLCKGQQFADNEANVQEWTPGQKVNFRITLTIPHAGSANVSIVDTKSNTVVGAPLLDWPSGYAEERAFYAKQTPANQTDFDITVPTDLGGKCAMPGDCVVQWWWYGTGAKQTYESCVDFTVAEA